MLPLRLGVLTHPASSAAAPNIQSPRMFHLDLTNIMSIVAGEALRHHPGIPIK